jgi:DNA-directed RNA polymerase specialized sigma24 family protein
VAGAICHDAELGRDAVQTAFTIAVRERRTFHGSGPLEAWVWRIVVNEAARLGDRRERGRLLGLADRAAGSAVPEQVQREFDAANARSRLGFRRGRSYAG